MSENAYFTIFAILNHWMKRLEQKKCPRSLHHRLGHIGAPFLSNPKGCSPFASVCDWPTCFMSSIWCSVQSLLLTEEESCMTRYVVHQGLPPLRSCSFFIKTLIWVLIQTVDTDAEKSFFPLESQLQIIEQSWLKLDDQQ